MVTGPAIAAAWLERFLHEQAAENRINLNDLLCQLHRGALTPGLRLCICVQKHHASWVRWLERELGSMRAQGVSVEIYLLMFCDAFPASWHGVQRYWSDSLVDLRNLRSFRVKNVFLEPPSMVVITAGSGQLLVLKRLILVHLSTGDMPIQEAPGVDLQILRWKEPGFPAFDAMQRLYFDFDLHDESAVRALCQSLVHEFRCDFGGHTTRSLGDSPRLKRRCMILSFPSDFDIDDASLARAVATLMRRYEVRAAVGWEQLFEHPEGSYRLDVEDLAVVRDDCFYRSIGHVVVVGKRRLVLTPCPGVDAQEIALALHEYNATHLTAPSFKALTSFSGDRIYDRPTPSVLHSFAGRRPRGSPGAAPEDLVMTMIGAPNASLRDLVNQWLLGC